MRCSPVDACGVLWQVWCGLFPTDAAEYDSLRDALSKLKLNDAALAFEPENSLAMGFGFR